jgi:uncharacterized membrane protein YgcG
LVPYTNQKLGPNDEVVRELASVVDLTPGQVFPPLGPSKVVVRPFLADGNPTEKQPPPEVVLRLRESTVNNPNANAASGLSNGSSGGAGAGGGGGNHAFETLSHVEGDVSVPPSPFHFIVIEKLECVVISRQDLLDLCPADVLRRLMENRSLTDVSNEEIEERYLTAQGWRRNTTGGGGMKELAVGGAGGGSGKDGGGGGSWSNPVVSIKKENLKVDSD